MNVFFFVCQEFSIYIDLIHITFNAPQITRVCKPESSSPCIYYNNLYKCINAIRGKVNSCY